MNPNLLTHEDLKDWANIRSKAKLTRWLNENRVAYTFDAKGRPITTLDQLNKALAGEEHESIAVDL